MANRSMIGGSFAPPLTDDLLAEYRQLIDAVEPRSQLRDALDQLYRCVMQWWELPESKKAGRRHPVGIGVIIELEEAHAKALWEAIPWETELQAIELLIGEIEADVAVRNSGKIEAWQKAVQAAIVAKHFPELTVFRAALKLAKSASEWLGILRGEAKKEVTQQLLAIEACRSELTAALAAKSYDGLPYPTPEPTPLRNAAHHLLWHVKELNFDREPITNDKL